MERYIQESLATGYIQMGLRVLWKIIVTQHSPLLLLEMQLEILLCKEEGIYSFCAETLRNTHRVLWALSHSKLTERQQKHVLWSDESTFQLVFGKNFSFSGSIVILPALTM